MFFIHASKIFSIFHYQFIGSIEFMQIIRTYTEFIFNNKTVTSDTVIQVDRIQITTMVVETGHASSSHVIFYILCQTEKI